MSIPPRAFEEAVVRLPLVFDPAAAGGVPAAGFPADLVACPAINDQPSKESP